MPNGFSKGFALAVGIANYLHVSKLPAAVLNDASDVANLLKNKDYCGFSGVKLLSDQKATGDGIRKGFQWLARKCTGVDDTAVVFFSGHGGRVESGKKKGAYLLPFDCDPDRLKETAIGRTELTELFSAIKAKRLVILLDSCHAAAAGELTKALAPHPSIKAGLDEKTYGDIMHGTGRIIMASCRSDEFSIIPNGWSNSLFTHYLLEALKGAAPTHGDGWVRVFEVFIYVSDKVPAESPTQHPIFKAHNLETNFPLARRLGAKQAPISTPGIVVTSEMAPRPQTQDSISGPAMVALIQRLVDRWEPLAVYFGIPPGDRDAISRSQRPPLKLLDWLQQRGQLWQLRDGFTFLRFDDLIPLLDPDVGS